MSFWGLSKWWFDCRWVTKVSLSHACFLHHSIWGTFSNTSCVLIYIVWFIMFWISCYSYRKNPRGILISPGPGQDSLSSSVDAHWKLSIIWFETVIASIMFSSAGAPQDSGISLQTVLELGPTIPLFGVCMGLQCIGEAFGGQILVCKLFPFDFVVTMFTFELILVPPIIFAWAKLFNFESVK